LDFPDALALRLQLFRCRIFLFVVAFVYFKLVMYIMKDNMVFGVIYDHQIDGMNRGKADIKEKSIFIEMMPVIC
jgi:hypothetical protein